MYATAKPYHFSVMCLAAMGKIEEATIIVSQLVEEHPLNADLLIIRARLCYKDKTKVIYSNEFFFLIQNVRLSREESLNLSNRLLDLLHGT